jgi:hypothetical protein
MYKSIRVEAVYPDGEVRVRNAFITENSAVKAGGPRQRLFDLAMLTMRRWNEVYPHHPAKLRLSR